LRFLGVDEWLVSVYEDATTVMRVNGRYSKAFRMRVGVYQESVLVSSTVRHSARSFVQRVYLPMELLYADDLVLMAELLVEVLEMEKEYGGEGYGETKVMK